MPQIIENFFENNIFTFQSYGCDCVEDIEHTVPGMPPLKTYKFQSYTEKPLLFGYRAKTGLSRIATNGTTEEDNILGALIALPTKKPSDLYSFFKRNGFLFPVSSSEYERIDATLLYEFILRIKATVELMTAVNEIHKDYNKIAHLTFYLMLSEELQIPDHHCQAHRLLQFGLAVKDAIPPKHPWKRQTSPPLPISVRLAVRKV